jgi:hypothetical protein
MFLLYNRKDISGDYYIEDYYSQVVETHVLVLSPNFHFDDPFWVYVWIDNEFGRIMVCYCGFDKQCIYFRTSTKTQGYRDFIEFVKSFQIWKKTYLFFYIILGIGEEFATILHFKTQSRTCKFDLIVALWLLWRISNTYELTCSAFFLNIWHQVSEHHSSL